MHVTLIRRVPIALVSVFWLCGLSLANADTITVAWDANTDPVSGYSVYVGTQRVDVGNATSYTLATAAAGQEYCFSVAAYNAGGEGPRSGQVCGYSNRFPVLSAPANQTSTVGTSVSLQLAGSDPDGSAVTYSATGLPPGLSLGWNTGFVSGSPATAGTYSVTATVSDGVLTSAARNFTWSVSASSTADTVAPTVTIMGPTSASTYTTTAPTFAMSGTSSDNVGVTFVTWSSNRGGSGTAIGTVNWSVASVGLQTGTNAITVTARDGSGNVSTDVLTVTYSVPDTTLPAVTISGPTTSSAYTTTSSALTISGTSSDNIGVTQVIWANNRGGSGTATGTANWSATGLVLQSGTNVITVTARDAAANQNTDVLTVTYNAPDTTAPAITIVGPTTATSYSTTSSVVTVGGNSSDNLGVTAVTWANDRGGSGFSSGTASWSVPSVALQGGTNIITVTAQDAAGNRGTDTLTVTYAAPDTTAPAIAITGPTTSSSFATNASTFAIGGTASDNVGVTQVLWMNDRGGSGTASGTATWSVQGIALQLGTNLISVRARDAAGNLADDVLTVTYSAPSPAPTPTPTPSIALSGQIYTSGRWLKALLQWSPVSGRTIDIYRDGMKVDKTTNDGSHTDSPRGSAPFTYRICVTGTTVCSNTVTVTN